MRLTTVAALLLAVGALATTVTYRRDLATARARVSSGLVAETACGPIEYAVRGTGPTVLVVHGAGGGFDQGLALGAGLVERGLRVLAVSRFGYLGTPLPAEASAAAQADAHACLLDALGIDRAAVLGASAGAPSALELALRHPRRVSALVLLAPALYTPRARGAPSVTPAQGTELAFDTALRSDFAFWAATRLAPSLLTRALLATPPELVAAATPRERARVARLLADLLPVSARRLGLLNDAAITTGLERSALEHVVVPTLAVSARDDLFGTYDAAQYSAGAIPGGRFVGYDTGGHVLVDRNDDVMNAIAAFIAAESGEQG
jgi:2-hydroxy-6-oxonona-2,4-dienedioate hydrolase